MQHKFLLLTLTLTLIAGSGYAAGGGQPQPQSVHGVTILIDFDDYPAAYTPAEVDDFMNLPAYTGYGTNGSVRDYFLDVSDGLFDYTNEVTTEWFRAPEDRSYYGDPSDGRARMRALIRLALQWFDSGGFEFINFDADGDGSIDAINVLIAGAGLTGGLQAHADASLAITLDGYLADRYQVTGLRQDPYGGKSSPGLVTVVHENGHMLFDWPDLYPLSGSSSGDIGAFCVMGGATTYGDYRDPVEPNAFLKWKAGWITPLEFDGLTANAFLRDDINQCAIIRHPDYPQNQEAYILENRQAEGRDSRLPASGIAIYRVADASSVDSEIYLVEADGGSDVRDGLSDGDVGDLWSAPHYTAFDFWSFPSLRWADGAMEDFHMENISGLGATMSFTYGFHDYADISVSPFPSGLNATWTIALGSTWELGGQGDEAFQILAGHNYTVTFDDIPYWTTPAPITKYADAGLAYPVYFNGAYTGSFLPISGSGLIDSQDATAVTMIDIDADGDDDIFVANESGQNRLLRNDGYSFVDITPSIIANAGNTQMAAWADADNDGDLDAFLASSTGANVLLEQTSQSPLTFVDVTSQIPNAAAIGAVRSASWSDVDQDGMLDLFLARHADVNLLFTGNPVDPMSFSAADLAGYVEGGRGTVGARFGDYDDDGYSDLFLTAFDGSSAPSRIVHNGSGALGHPGSYYVQFYNDTHDATWADIDNDQKVDLVLLDGRRDITIRLNEWDSFDGKWTFVEHPVNFAGGDIISFALGDFNNDGWLDIYCDRPGEQDTIAMNDGTTSPNGVLEFTSVPLGYDLHAGPGFAAAAMDFNNDGGLDLFVGKGGTTDIVILNFLMTRGNWLEFDLSGTSVNAGAVGAKVYVTAGGMTQVREVAAGGGPGQGSRILHFGLGTATTADAVRVVWDGSGSETVLNGVAANQKLAISQQGAARSFPKPDAPSQEIPRYTTTFGGVSPNPFNPQTSISFTLATETDVHAAIYDLRGRKVAELVNQKMKAGPHELEWSGKDVSGRGVASGTYLFRMTAGNREFRSKLILVK